MKVCFDVYGADLVDIREAALATLATFLRRANPAPEWRIDIDVHEETRSSDDEITLWRGEVTAESPQP